MKYIVNKCLLSKLDKWSADVGRRHEKSATCLSKLHIYLKKKSIITISDGGVHISKTYSFSSCLNVRSIPYPPPSPPPPLTKRKKLPDTQ